MRFLCCEPPINLGQFPGKLAGLLDDQVAGSGKHFSEVIMSRRSTVMQKVWMLSRAPHQAPSSCPAARILLRSGPLRNHNPEIAVADQNDVLNLLLPARQFGDGMTDRRSHARRALGLKAADSPFDLLVIFILKSLTAKKSTSFLPYPEKPKMAYSSPSSSRASP